MTRLHTAALNAGRSFRLALLSAALAVPALVPSATLGQPTGVAVEYYHAGFDHFFITARQSEIGDLDGGAFGGAWRRTGQSFLVWTAGGPSTAETCRLFTVAFPPKSSHFYTPLARECASLRQGTTWQFEDVAFHLKVDALGNCPAGSAPLFRLYNNFQSGAPNHRYTTSRTIFDQMVAQGWTAEGAGAQTVFACVPSTAAAAVASGWFEGTTSAREELIGMVLDDGSFYFLYSDLESAPSSAGLVEGRAAFTGNEFVAAQAREYTVLPSPSESAATVTGTLVAQATIAGTIETGARTRTFTARYEHAVGGPVALAPIAGSYAGVGVSDMEVDSMTVTLAPNGRFTGFPHSFPGCPFTGTLVPRLTAGFMDVTVSFEAACWFGLLPPMTGIGYYNATGAGELLIVAHPADGHGVFVFTGDR